MAYEGYLLKIGNYIFPRKYIKAESYKSYINSQALDPYTDAEGKEHIEFVDLDALKVEFETVALIDNRTFSEIMQNIDSNKVSKKKAMVTAYIPELNAYVTQLSYIADIQPTMYIATDDYIKYNPIKLSFIGGVASD